MLGHRSIHRYWTIIALLVSVAAAGCGQKGRQVVHISGKVTHAGKPLSKVTVYFMPNVGRPSWTVTDDQGHFSDFLYTKEKSGVVVGTHKVHVLYSGQQPKNIDEEMRMQGKKPAPPAEWADVPAKYKSESTTDLEVEVKSEGQVIDLALD